MQHTYLKKQNEQWAQLKALIDAGGPVMFNDVRKGLKITPSRASYFLNQCCLLGKIVRYGERCLYLYDLAEYEKEQREYRREKPLQKEPKPERVGRVRKVKPHSTPVPSIWAYAGAMHVKNVSVEKP